MVPSRKPQRSIRLRRRTIAGASAAAVATLAFLGSGGVAVSQEAEPAFRGVGNTGLRLSSATINSISVFCVRPGENILVECDLAGTASMTVDAATKRKLNLSSATIAKGTYRKKGEGGGMDLAASAAVRKKLKAVKTLTVTYKLAVTSPVVETVTKKVVMRTSGAARLALRSKRDTAVVSGD